MTVDPLYILLLVDAVVILSGALIYMVLRPKEEPSAAPPPESMEGPPAVAVPDFDVIRRSRFLRMLQDNIKETEEGAGLDQKGDDPESKGVLLDQIYNLNLDLLKNLQEALGQENTDPLESIAEVLTVKFRMSVNDKLLSFMRSLEQQPAPTLTGRDKDPSSFGDSH